MANRMASNLWRPILGTRSVLDHADGVKQAVRPDFGDVPVLS